MYGMPFGCQFQRPTVLGTATQQQQQQIAKVRQQRRQRQAAAFRAWVRWQKQMMMQQQLLPGVAPVPTSPHTLPLPGGISSAQVPVLSAEEIGAAGPADVTSLASSGFWRKPVQLTMPLLLGLGAALLAAVYFLR